MNNNKTLICPICDNPTRIYMGNARKDGLCGKHADLLKAGEIKINDKLQTVFEQCLISVDYAINIVVLKTMSGAAQAVAYALDTFTWQEIVGSIAGDDTVMIVVRNEKSAKQLVAKLAKYIHH